MDLARTYHFLVQGQYTKKIYHIESKVPAFIKFIAPKGSLQLHEEAWNAHPTYCRTLITNPGYMKANFSLKIETMCLDDDDGQTENAHELSPELLSKRKVIKVDIANDQAPMEKDGYDPR